mmetsp:Transcript_35771/g.113750  ORF Transcript_35771/g.113750 Transcript_35771/m.113750 type:complete len:224 (+) Transcript_35771:1223-1894(+)
MVWPWPMFTTMPWSMPCAQSDICASGAMRTGPARSPTCACTPRAHSLALSSWPLRFAVAQKGSPTSSGRSAALRTGTRFSGFRSRPCGPPGAAAPAPPSAASLMAFAGAPKDSSSVPQRSSDGRRRRTMRPLSSGRACRSLISAQRPCMSAMPGASAALCSLCCGSSAAASSALSSSAWMKRSCSLRLQSAGCVGDEQSCTSLGASLSPSIRPFTPWTTVYLV